VARVPKPAIQVLDGEFTVHRCGPSATVPPELTNRVFCWIARTDEELSIVCDSSIRIESEARSVGWSCLRVKGPLDLELTGILAGITNVLAAADVAIFSISTFNTDYVLVKAEHKDEALQALLDAGYPSADVG